MIQGDLRQKPKGQSNRERTECRIEVRWVKTRSSLACSDPWHEQCLENRVAHPWQCAATGAQGLRFLGEARDGVKPTGGRPLWSALVEFAHLRQLLCRPVPPRSGRRARDRLGNYRAEAG